MNKSKKSPSLRVPELFPLVLLSILILTGCSAANQSGPVAAVLDTLDPASSLAEQITAGMTPTGTPRLLAAQNGTLQNIYEQVNPSVVHIQVVSGPLELPFDHPSIPEEPVNPDGPGDPGDPNGPDDPGGQTKPDGLPAPDNLIPGAPPQSFGEGSGFVWDKEGHIVTNNHVIDGAQKITVLFADDTAVRAELVGADPDSDLAVLLVDLPADKLQPITLGDSTGLQVGDLAIAIGNPFGQEGTMTAGIVSALGRLLPVEAGNPFTPRFNIPDVIQTDAAINPGNSGGVLLDDQGMVIGVTTAIISGDRASSAGIGFAVPSAIVKQVVPVLIADGHYDHPYIGISGGSLTPDIAEAMDLPAGQRGVLVATVMPETPAGEAGLLANDDQIDVDGFEIGIGGDVIIAANGQLIVDMDDLITFLERHTKVGQTIELTILRDGEQKVIDLTLAARPERAETPLAMLPDINPGATPDENKDRPRLGILGQALTPELAGALDLPAGQTGILIQQVIPGSPADSAGLLGGDTPLDEFEVLTGGDIITAISGTPVVTTQDLISLLDQFKAGDEVTLDLLRDGEELAVILTLG